MAENEKSLAQEYKDLNRKINKLKSEIDALVKEDRKVNVDNTAIISTKQNELNSLEEQRRKNRELSKERIAGSLSAIESKKSQSELKRIEEEIAYIERTGNRPNVPGQRGPASAATDEYLNSLKTRRDEILNKPTAGTKADITQTQTGYGTPLTTTGGATPATTKYIDNVADYASIETTGREGIFNAGEIGEDVIFLAQPGKQVASGITINQFTNNLWGLSPSVISEYKKAIGYKDTTGVVTKDFADTLIAKILPISEANYRNAVNNKPAASFEELIISPDKYTSFVGSSISGGGVGTASAQDIKVKADAIRIYAADLGVGLDDAAVNKLARQWAAGNFDATTIKPQIARSGQIDFTKGSAAEQLNTLKELAGSYGIQYDQGWYNTAATNVLTGKDDIETYKQYVKDQAKSKYPALSKQIDDGFTVRQLASSYTTTMANLLEIDEQSIGLDDYYVNQALTGLDAQGNPVQKPLWQFQQEIRKNDPRWRYTRNAEESMMSASRKVLQDFGLVS